MGSTTNLASGTTGWMEILILMTSKHPEEDSFMVPVTYIDSDWWCRLETAKMRTTNFLNMPLLRFLTIVCYQLFEYDITSWEVLREQTEMTVSALNWFRQVVSIRRHLLHSRRPPLTQLFNTNGWVRVIVASSLLVFPFFTNSVHFWRARKAVVAQCTSGLSLSF